MTKAKPSAPTRRRPGTGMGTAEFDRLYKEELAKLERQAEASLRKAVAEAEAHVRDCRDDSCFRCETFAIGKPEFVARVRAERRLRGG